MNRLRELRKKAGLSSRMLGNKLGISYSMICRIENETRSMSIETAELFCKYFNVSLEFLLGKDFVSDSKGQEITDQSRDNSKPRFNQLSVWLEELDERELTFIMHECEYILAKKKLKEKNRDI